MRIWTAGGQGWVLPLVVDVGRHFERRLNPSFRILGRMLLLSPTEPAAMPVRRLRDAVANLDADRDRIIAALDMVFTGIRAYRSRMNEGRVYSERLGAIRNEQFAAVAERFDLGRFEKAEP